MRTRSSSNLVGESSPNPNTSNLKRRNRRRSNQPFILEESPLDTMADQRTMAKLLRAPTGGYAEVVPTILAEHFELKHSLINMMASDQFFGLEKDNPHDHIRWFNKITSTIKYKDMPNSAIKLMLFPFPLAGAARRWLEKEPPRSILTWEDLDRHKDLLRACPHHGFTELHQLNTFYNALIPADQDSLNSAAGGNLLERRTQDALTIIKKNPSAVTTAMTTILKQFQATPPTAFIKAIEESCVTCGGPLPSNTIANSKGEVKAITTRSELAEYTIKVPPPLVQKAKPASQRNYVVHQRDPRRPHIPYPSGINQEKQQEKYKIQIHKFWQMFKQLHINITLVNALILIPKYQKMLKALLSNKEKLSELANTPLNENCSAVILKKLPKKLGDPGKFLILCGFSELKCKALANLGASINLRPLLVWKKLGLPKLISTRMTLELANRAIYTPTGIARDVFVSAEKFTFPASFVIVDYERDPRVSLILGRPFLRTTPALIDVHEEEMILRDGDERLTLNMRHDTSSYSNQPHKESINMINICNDSYEDYLEDLFTINHLTGNLTFSSHTDLTSPKVNNPLSGNTTSSPDHLLEEFADELALITFPPRNDDLPFDIESHLREIEYLLNHDPTKERDSILEDSVDECNRAYPNIDLFDTILEMFTDEHTLDYSSLPLYDDVNDDLVELESDNDDVYNDPFDSKEDKIKESKLLIDKLDPPRSSDLLPSPEYDSVIYEDFFKVDALPSTNNEDKVFNPGILIHENLFEVTIQVTPDKNVKRISLSNASLILKDFPPLYELPFHKEVLGSETLLSFSFENEEKFSTLGFLLLKEFILLFSRNYLIGALKLSKSLKFLKAQWRFFLALMERTSVF
nr:hypothetical protein [Tanacetum cinerariifolium]